MSVYCDAQGRPRLQSSIVGFLDLLGFSNLVLTTPDEASQPLLDKICHAIADSRQYVRDVLAEEFAANPAGWALKFFSDNLVLGYSYEGTNSSVHLAAWFIVRCAQRYQLRMALNGLFMRGALTNGPICLTDEIIFGKALLESYHLEEKVATVPRIILSDSLSSLLTTEVPTNGTCGAAETGEAICRDVDGRWFVNYLHAAKTDQGIDWSLIERHKQSVLTALSSTTRHDVLPKFGWTCRYHNMFCHWHQGAPGYADDLRIERDDEHSIIRRLGELRG
jgi:hypothetical protein